MLEFGARKCFDYLMKKKKKNARTINYFTILMWQIVIDEGKNGRFMYK